MSHAPPPPWSGSAAPPPSWIGPISLGAAVTFALHTAPLLLQDVLWCCLTCCLGSTGIPGGVAAALMAASRDPRVRWGQGFVVAFLASGVGGLPIGFLTAMDPPVLSDEQRTTMREGFQEQPEMTEEQIGQIIELAADVYPMLPFFNVLAVIVVGGLAGMVTAGFVNRLPPTPGPHPPTPPHG